MPSQPVAAYVFRGSHKWGTLDSDRDIRNKLYLSEWRLESSYRIDTGWRDVQIELGAGASLDSRVTYRDHHEGRQKVRMENRLYGMVALRW